jgi:NAD(P)H-hydrate epimerase
MAKAKTVAMAKSVKRIQTVAHLAPRRRDAHKGDFGRVLVVGGSSGMIGAVGLACNAALRGGAGLVTFAAPRTVQPFIATVCPCATSIPLAADDRGQLQAEAVRQVVQAAGRADVLAIGPGMATGSVQQQIVRAALELTCPVVLDADGLNNLAAIDGWPAIRRCPLILTPHPGEFSRLTQRPTKDIQARRESAVRAAMKNWLAAAPRGAGAIVCVLKGAGTVVSDGRRVYVNETGNPGMATGGTGDVLTGLTAALIGQGLKPFEAACLAVRCHGRAGDLAAEQLGQVSLIASDLLDFLPAAMKEVVA